MAVARLGLASLLFVIFFIPQYLRAQTQPQKIVIGGAQSLVPLAEKFSARFRKDHPEIEVEIRRANSNYAVTATQAGEIQIGLVTRNLTAAEIAALHVEPVGHDAIIFLSYPWNQATSLTLEQLRKIYLGKITNWREVGGEDKGIVPLTREGSSTLHSMFIDSLFGKGFNGAEKAFVLRANKEKILRTIKRVRGSLGYGIVGLEEAQDEGVKVLAINGKSPNEANIVQGVYPFTRPLLLIGKGPLNPLVQGWMRGFAQFAHREGDR
ncbi:MAG: substrate-binding domain-containing protein [Candidatus Binatia bacterium]